MKHYLKLLLATLLLPFFALAQNNYKPGYVVTLKGDTIRGKINQKEWYGNPRSIDFKAQTGTKTYTVDDIRFFEISNSSSYQKYSGLVTVDETNTARLASGIDSAKKQDVIFLKVEQNGVNVVLYSYTDAIKTRYFIRENSRGKIDELIFRVYFLPDRGVQTRTENVFISQLYELANRYNTSSTELKRSIESAGYNSSDLKVISQRLNNMTDDKRNYGEQTSISFFGGLGINMASFKPDGTFPFFNPQTHTSMFPTASLGVDFEPNPAVGKLIIRGEFSVTGAQYKSNVSVYFYEPQYDTEYKINQIIVSLNPQVLYNVYNTKAFKFYIDGGFAINLSKNSGNTLRNSKLDITTPDYLSLTSSWFSFSGKAGIILNKTIDIGVSYSFPASITNNKGYTIDVTCIKAGVNYKF